MKVLLTGSNGFIGSYLAEELSKKNYNVRCLVRSSSNLKWMADLDVELFYGDLFDKNSIKSALKDIDYIYHLAGVTKSIEKGGYEKGNFIGTKNVVDAVIESKIDIKRFLFVSSQAAYGPGRSLDPIDENHFPAPLTDYGKSKLQAQKYVEQNSKKIPTTIVIPPSVYGPRDTDFLQFFKTVKMGIIPHVGGRDKYISIIHAKDLSNGMVEAAESSNSIGGAYFISNEVPVAWSEIARITLNHLGKRAVNITLPIGLVKSIAGVSELISRIIHKPNIINRQKVLEMKPDFWICSPAKAKKDFGYQSRIDLDEGIKDTLAWYVSKNWL